jgi:hypothetical protein
MIAASVTKTVRVLPVTPVVMHSSSSCGLVAVVAGAVVEPNNPFDVSTITLAVGMTASA